MSLWKKSLVSRITARPRHEITTQELAGVRMRVAWWRPGRGERHPAMLWVIGATPEGIDFPELRLAAEGFARAGYLVMIPEFPFLLEERLDPTAPAQIAAAFDGLRAHAGAREPVGALGFSIGGGVLLATAAADTRVGNAPYLGVVGAYFDMTTYLACVVSGTQRRAAGMIPWVPSPDVPGRVAAAATRLARNAEERAMLERALGPASYEDARAALAALPDETCRAFDALSARPGWDRIRAPVFWLHDERDAYVPVAELDAARRARRDGRLRVLIPRLVQHAVAVSDDARSAGPRFWIPELSRLFRFAASVLRAAG